MDWKREDHVVWFATWGDREKAEACLPIKGTFGDVYATVDSEALTAAELNEMLDDFRLDGMLVKDPELAVTLVPGI